MRAQARPSVPKGFLVLGLLLGGALLLGPGRAWAAGSVIFDHVTVDRCGERGDCEWRLSCGVGDDPQETELLANAKARTKYSVEIGKSFPVGQFPAKVHCTAWEDDGWFSESWEEVGKGSVTVPAGGEYRLTIVHQEQGALEIQMFADSLEMGIAPPPPPPAPAAGKPAPKAVKPAPQPQFLALFNPAKEGHAVVIGLEWKPFRARVDELAAEGLQIERVETFKHGGKRLWAGIFRNSSDQVQLVADRDPEQFVDAWKKLTGGRMRLTDLEFYEGEKKYQYAGIFRDLGEVHAFWAGMDRKSLTNKAEELKTGRGEQLLDLEVYRVQGKLYYDGAFRQAPRETRLWTGLDLDGLKAKIQGLRGKEWELADIATYTEGKKRFYDAVIREGGTPGEVAMAADPAAFAKRWQELVAKGLRLVSLEIYYE
jgi:hypothetical protein